MDFRTTIHIADNMGIMHHSDRFMMLGSCFSDNIGGKLHQAMIDVNVNPFGTLYNPMSIASSVNRIINAVPERGIDLFQGSGVWNSYNFHSRYSLADKEATLTLMNEQIAKAHEHLKLCHTLVVTLGTAESKPKGRFFWFVEGWGCFIYLASGNQKNRPFGYVFTFLLARKRCILRKRCIFGEKGVCLEKKVYFCRLITVQNRENGLSHHYTHCRQYGHYAS